MIGFNIAVRSLLRNRRRSIVTMLSIVVGIVTLLVFGGFVSSIHFGMQTNIVRQQGHLHIMPRGYLEYGPSRPTDFYIEEYQELIDLIRNDAELQDKIRVITAILQLSGIAGNYEEDSSKTYVGIGVVPSEQNQMKDWDPYHFNFTSAKLPLSDDMHDTTVIGYGMARMLNLCDELAVPECQDVARTDDTAKNLPDADIAILREIAEDDLPTVESEIDGLPRIDLLSASAGGAPNALSLYVVSAQQQGVRALDNSYVAMNLQQAQQLLYGGEQRVSSIVLQLHSSDMIDTVQDRLDKLLTETNSELEVKRFSEFNQMYERVMRMFGVIFTFISIVICLIVLFTVINTMTMSVMERTAEVGTLRALGLRRSGVRRQFLLEGVLLGIVGTTLGLIIAIIIASLLNNAGVSWTPPSNAAAQPLRILITENPVLPVGAWLLLVCVTTLSSLLPARRAARMNVVAAIHNA